MICNCLSAGFFLVSTMFILWTQLTTTEAMHIDKRQIGVLARTGALPQGKRSIEILARNGELPLQKNSKENQKEETLDAFVKDLQKAQTIINLKLDALTEEMMEDDNFQDSLFGKRSVNGENDGGERSGDGKNSQGDKKLSEVKRRSGYLIKPPQESLDLFDPQNFFGNEYRKKQDLYLALPPEYQMISEPIQSHSSAQLDNLGNFIEKRFLGRIPQLGRTHQKVQSPSSRRRPHLRPNWL